MVDSLLDTSIVIDILRQYEAAENWLATIARPGLSAMVWLEVLDGVNSRQAENQAMKVLKRFERLDPTLGDYSWAIEKTTKFKLSHHVGAIDCLIAATSYRLQVPLYTGNLKHFIPLLGSLARKPY